MPAKKKAKQGRKSLPEELRRRIARRFREIRDRDFGSARQLAERLGTVGKTAQGWCAPTKERAVGAWANLSSPDLSSLLTFAEMTGYRLGYLLGDDGPEYETEDRSRATLVEDVAAVLTPHIPVKLRELGLQVHGTSAMAHLLMKVEEGVAAIQPLTELQGLIENAEMPEDYREKLQRAMAQVTARTTQSVFGLLSFSRP